MILEQDEQILYESSTHVDKTDMQLGKIFIFLLVMIFFWIIAILANTLVFLVVIIFIICLIYAFIYNVFSKNKYKNEVYFITNKRIIKYDYQNKLIYKNISDIEQIQISREKNGYGDLVFEFITKDDIVVLNSERNLKELASNLKTMIKATIGFSGIENARNAVKIITNINPRITITYDKPISNI